MKSTTQQLGKEEFDYLKFGGIPYKQGISELIKFYLITK